MGAPPHLVLPDPSQQRPSLSSPAFSPDSFPTSSSLSSSDSSSSSFSRSFPLAGDPAPYIFEQEEKQQQQQRKHNAVLEKTVRQKNRAKLKQISKSSSAETLRECKIASSSCTKGISMRKACCRSAGAFAADCAAVSCCPCAVFSLLSLVLIELPSSVARKLVTRLQRRRCMKDAMSSRSSRGGENSLSSFIATWSHREASEGEPAASIIRFSTENLLEHFEAEHVGFGCLSRERE